MVEAQPDMWTILWPVIIGGLLATLPAVLAQLLTHALSQSSAKKTRRRERFQRIADEIANLEVWLDKRRSELAFGGKEVEEPDPLPGIMTLAMMDFPELLPALDILSDRAGAYRSWQYDAAKRRLAGEIATISKGIDEVFRPYWAQFLVVQDGLRAIAARGEFR